MLVWTSGRIARVSRIMVARANIICAFQAMSSIIHPTIVFTRVPKQVTAFTVFSKCSIAAYRYAFAMLGGSCTLIRAMHV